MCFVGAELIFVCCYRLELIMCVVVCLSTCLNWREQLNKFKKYSWSLCVAFTRLIFVYFALIGLIFVCCYDRVDHLSVFPPDSTEAEQSSIIWLACGCCWHRADLCALASLDWLCVLLSVSPPVWTEAEQSGVIWLDCGRCWCRADLCALQSLDWLCVLQPVSPPVWIEAEQSGVI